MTATAVSAVAEHTTAGPSGANEPDTDSPAVSEDHPGRHREYEGRHRADPDGLSVWATAQSTGPAQRRGRYVPESTAHPPKMLPAIAATAIAAYTQPGDLVAGPDVRHRHHPGRGRPRSAATPSASSTSRAGRNSPTPTSATPTTRAPPDARRSSAATPPS